MTNEAGTAGKRTDGRSDRELGPEQAAIYVDGLTKTFGSGKDAVRAIDDVSFAVEPGTVVGLLGPNGAGKTTTIKSILGLVYPDEGEVFIDGIDAYEHPKAAYSRVDAMLEGARNDLWRLTARENLRYFASIGGENPDVVADRQEDLLEMLDLADRGDDPVRDLSRGMKQKVSLASVLAGDVSVAFLDEPTLGLDVESSLTLRRELMRLVEDRQLTVFVSSHDMDVIQDICDRVIILNDGRIVADETVPDLLELFETKGYRITVSGLDESATAELRDRFDVRSLERFDDRVRLEVDADSEEFYELTNVLEAQGVTLKGVETVEPDLEEAFLEITGRND